MKTVMNIGVVGYGKAGTAVASILAQDPRYCLVWVATRSGEPSTVTVHGNEIPVIALDPTTLGAWLDAHPVDALVDFSGAASVHVYGEHVRQRGLMLVTAISSYDADDMAYVQSLGTHARVLCSPNITVGINFLILAAKLLRDIAPFADIEILEQHFGDKPEVSGTAKKIAQSLSVDHEKIVSMRLGGIVGHHEVIFGFPHQTVRLIHESIRREAFGTGVAFALAELKDCANGFYSFDDLLTKRV